MREGNQITVNNTLTGETNVLFKSKNKWRMEGTDKTYRNPKSAIDELSGTDIMNVGLPQGA